mmetsp:Transcript_10824/g.27366  ORF Transcript_10824/g.27366 Transcript_10824/m.27366 type:complete len:164 (-) Transcript_10824:23-514(-)
MSNNYEFDEVFFDETNLQVSMCVAGFAIFFLLCVIVVLMWTVGGYGQIMDEYLNLRISTKSHRHHTHSSRHGSPSRAGSMEASSTTPTPASTLTSAPAATSTTTKHKQQTTNDNNNIIKLAEAPVTPPRVASLQQRRAIDELLTSPDTKKLLRRLRRARPDLG